MKNCIPAYGDRVALQQSCRRRGQSKNKNKTTLFQKLKQRKELTPNSSGSNEDKEDDKRNKEKGMHLYGNRYAERQHRRVDIGWLHYDFLTKQFKQVKEKNWRRNTKNFCGKKHQSIVLVENCIDIVLPRRRIATRMYWGIKL